MLDCDEALQASNAWDRLFLSQLRMLGINSFDDLDRMPYDTRQALLAVYEEGPNCRG